VLTACSYHHVIPNGTYHFPPELSRGATCRTLPYVFATRRTLGRMRDHVRAYDFPETSSRWHSLGREAGFAQVRELFVAPTDFFRMYCFQA
jgi:hypothetical protein